MKKKIYDAIVIGSGITGGWAAKELTEKGLDVLMLEAGRNIREGLDYSEHRPAYELKHRGLGDSRLLLDNYPVQSKCYACTENNYPLFVNDKENPYTTPSDKPFVYIRGRQVGGLSLLWARQVYRWSNLDFLANASEGVAAPWPISYEDLAPWYDYVEKFIGVSGAAEGLPHLPDGEFLPPMAMSCGERLIQSKVSEKWRGERHATVGRIAVNTGHRVTRRNGEGKNGRCHCGTRSSVSTLNTTLPAAQATGRLTLRPHSVVRHLIYDAERDRLSGVHVVDGLSMEEFEFHAKVVFLCASTLESTRVLLNSGNSRFPGGLANSSGVLGHYLMDHVYGSGAMGMPHGLDEYRDVGKRSNGICIPRFQNVNAKHPKHLRGYQLLGGSRREQTLGAAQLMSMGGMLPPGLGVGFKEAMKQPGPWFTVLIGFGECLPSHQNRVEINRDVRDKWGIPVLHITADWGENEKVIYDEMYQSAAEILEASGARNIMPIGPPTPIAPGNAIHAMGTARMGDDPQTSVLNKWNQAHDIKNLFVTDGSCMVSSACQNPSLTYMALTARAANYAVEEMRRGDL